MRKFKDDRGRSYCDVFPAAGPGDINLSVLYPGTIKAFHRHQHQADYWLCARGHLRAVLVTTEQQYVPFKQDYNTGPNDAYNNLRLRGIKLYTEIGGEYFPVDAQYQLTWTGPRPPLFVSREVPIVTEHFLSEGDLLHIPATVWHGVQNIGSGEACMVYHITNKYSETTPDEERRPWNAFGVTWERSKK